MVLLCLEGMDLIHHRLFKHARHDDDEAMTDDGA